MTNKTHLLIMGAALREARDKKNINQRVLSSLYKERRTAGGYPYAKNTLSNFEISKLENSKEHDVIARQKKQTVELLAFVLGVEVAQIATPETEVDKVGPPDEFAGKGDGEVKSRGLPADLPRIELPFTPVRARASFVEVLGSQSDYGEEEKITYILPPRPASDYMKNNSRVFEVNGDSMAPEIHSGELVIADLVPEGRWELLVNKIVVISYDETLTIKRVRENELLTRRVLTLYPAQPDLAPLQVRRELIRCIFVVTESFERKRWA